MLNKSKYLILGLIIVSLFLPRPASAILGTGIFDLFDHMLHGISEQTSSMVAIMIMMLFVYLVLLVLLWVSGFVLEAFIVHQAGWIVNLQGMTEAGWSFTAGIANMLLIIIFLVIAFAFIFKIESLQAKKSLPRLIIVAILLNFSLLFVNALADISQIGYNTILEAMPPGLIGTVTNILITPLLLSIAALVGLVVSLIVAWSIPIASAFAQILFAAIFIPFILPFLVLIGIQMLLFLPVAVMFLTFVFLFGARVFVIQILAMLAPLAFVCLILPQTKKYWDEWLQHLVQWLLLGIVVLFLLALGFTALDSLKSPLGSIIDCTGVVGPLQPICLFMNGVVGLAIFYFGVFVYLMAILFISKKFMPTFAGFLIDQGKAMAGNIFQRGIIPVGAATAYQWRKGLSQSKWVREKATRAATAPTPELRGLKKLAAPVVIPAYALRRGLGRAMGPAIRDAERKEILAAEKRAGEIQDVDLGLSKYRDAVGAGKTTDAIGIASNFIERGGPFKKTIKKELRDKPEQAIALAHAANDLKAVPEAERIARTAITKKALKDRPDLLKKMGFQELEELDKDKQKEWKAKGYKTALDELIGEAKGNEIKDFAEDFWESPKAMEAVQRFWGGPQISRAADEFGRTFVEDYMKVVHKLTPDQMAVFNPKSAMYLTGNPAQDLGFRAPEGISRGEMRNKVGRRPPEYIPSEEELGTLREKIREAFPETPSPEEEERDHRPDDI